MPIGSLYVLHFCEFYDEIVGDPLAEEVHEDLISIFLSQEAAYQWLSAHKDWETWHDLWYWRITEWLPTTSMDDDDWILGVPYKPALGDALEKHPGIWFYTRDGVEVSRPTRTNMVR